MPAPIQPARLAPDSTHVWRDTFHAVPCADGSWGVDQVTEWVDRHGERDMEGVGIAYGLSEAEAKREAERLNAGRVMGRAA